MDFDISTELLVVGAGLAGLTAANRALDLGRSAIVVETSDNPKNLCASRLSGGLFHVAYRSVLAPPEELVRKTMAATQGHVDTKLAQALAGNAARGVQWLKSKGVEFTSIEPDQGWRDHVAAPLGFYDQSHFVWEGLGADVLLNTLERRFLERGGRIIRDTRVFELAVKEGRVAGVIAINSITRIRIQAGAVVLADGGFQGNVEMLAQYVTPHPHKLKLRGPAAGRGDGIRMARELGAALVGMPYFYGHVLSADALYNDKLCPFPFVDFLAAAGMLVDDQAQRFVDESKAGVFMANAMARHGDGTATVIFDEPIWNEAGRVFFCPPNPNLVQGGGTLHKAQSLEELARLAGLDAKLLVASVQQRNNDLVAGKLNSSLDERGALKYQPVYIGQPPFYAAPACACITHTTGGLKVDAGARVLHEAGLPIRGLYVAGSTAGGLEGGPQAGYVGGLVKALVFGLLAAESFASEL